ncbi:MAG TPA: dienelactone hydrolase family protein, partial [Steroidobacteraceae bacterium]|nr:dienelactone hydrolase family protein [Steroidobacteraceae bacterium]
MKTFEYTANSKIYRGTLLTPKDAAPTAAVVLLPDWRGQSSLAFDHAQFLVELGCTVVIADLYGDGFSPNSLDQVGSMVQTLVDNRDTGVAALRVCIEQLQTLVTKGIRMYCLGYSAGGMIALDYARSGAMIDGFILCSALLKIALPTQSTHINA